MFLPATAPGSIGAAMYSHGIAEWWKTVSGLKFQSAMADSIEDNAPEWHSAMMMWPPYAMWFSAVKMAVGGDDEAFRDVSLMYGAAQAVNQ